MEKEDFDVYLKKQIKVNLKSTKFFQFGKLVEIKSSSIRLRKSDNRLITINMDDISTIEDGIK